MVHKQHGAGVSIAVCLALLIAHFSPDKNLIHDPVSHGVPFINYEGDYQRIVWTVTRLGKAANGTDQEK